MFGLRQLLERLPRPAARWSRLFFLGIVVGVLGGVTAWTLEAAIEWGTATIIGQVAHVGSAEILRFDWRVLLFPAAGGLISGILTRTLARKSVGHGTDLLIHAFHHKQGKLRLRGPAVRSAANVAVLSFGGSTGPEGPTAALGAAIGSTLGGALRLSPRERRIVLLAGCAAAVGAIFRCPLGGAMFATSVLYQEEEFESGAIVPSFVASVIAYSVFMSLRGVLGGHEYLLPNTDRLGFHSMKELIPYAGLGVLCGLVTMLFHRSLRFVEETVMPMSRLPRWLAPCVGGLVTGAIACAIPQVLDGRYIFIKNALNGFGSPPVNAWWWVWLFAAVILAKCVATAFTVGSGGSGGALGPAVFLGGVVGAGWWALLHAAIPGTFPLDSELRAAFIPVGMGGVLAAVMRTPLAAIVMVTEMTGSYGLIVPLMLVCVSSYVIGRRWGLNREQLPSMAQSPAHAGDAIVHMLESWRVAEFMEPTWTETVERNTPLREIIPRIQPGTRPVFAVAEGQTLLGVVSTSDIRKIMEEPGLAEVVIASDIMTERLLTLHPDVDMYQAMDQFRRSQHNVLPVVRREDGRWLGMIARERVYKRIQEHVAERQRQMLSEHAGLAAMQQEAEIQELVLGVGDARKNRFERIMVPIDAVGQSLRQADFRRRFHAQVIAIEQPTGEVQCPPSLDAPLTSSQRLLVLAEERDDTVATT